MLVKCISSVKLNCNSIEWNIPVKVLGSDERICSVTSDINSSMVVNNCNRQLKFYKLSNYQQLIFMYSLSYLRTEPDVIVLFHPLDSLPGAVLTAYVLNLTAKFGWQQSSVFSERRPNSISSNYGPWITLSKGYHLFCEDTIRKWERKIL